MTETGHPDGSDLDNRHRFGARARHAGDSPTAVRTADIRALARCLRSGLQACVYQAWICYRKASARGSSEIAARSPGMVVVGAVVAPTRARAVPGYLYLRRRSGMALVYPTKPSRDDQRSALQKSRYGRRWTDFSAQLTTAAQFDDAGRACAYSFCCRTRSASRTAGNLSRCICVL
jgi:hypothetical protein